MPCAHGRTTHFPKPACPLPLRCCPSISATASEAKFHVPRRFGDKVTNTKHDETNALSCICSCIILETCTQPGLDYVVEGNSRFYKVALGIPKIPGNSHGFPGIPGSFGNPSPSQELKRRPPPSGELRSTGPTLNLSPRHQWRVQSMAIQKEKPKNVAKWW